jgi:hypothetical protein
MKYIIVSLMMLSGLAGCAYTGWNSKTGPALYISTIEPVTATSSGKGSRAGISCAHNILGIAAFGDASIELAKKNGVVTSVTHVDQYYDNILGFYGRVCTAVHGN